VKATVFEVLAAPELFFCCFLYVPPEFQSQVQSNNDPGDATADVELDQLNTRIMNAVQRGGRAYLSSATIRGKFALRACITNFRTTRGDIDQTLEIIREAARNLA
jgi:glutamate/tyrosine decarboxylase-like PLP-dependent enzyme